MERPSDKDPVIGPYDPAHPTDLQSVTAIYGAHVRHGTASFEIDPPDCDEMQVRFASLMAKGYPILLLRSGETVLGFAYAGPHKARAAYNHTVEDSIYLHPDAMGRGYGSRLLAALIEATRARGFKQMIAVIGDSDNAASIGVHRAAGFTHIGIARNLGFKFNRYLDVVFMQLSLGEALPQKEQSNATSPSL